MQVERVALQNGGILSYIRWTITYLDLQATSGAGAKGINLVEVSTPGPSGLPANWSLPAGAKIIGSFVKHSVAFSGGSLSAMTVSVGKTGNATFFTAAQDIFQAVADTTVQENSMFKSGQMTALTPIVATFTPTSDVCSNCSAGSVDIFLAVLEVSTPLP